MFSDPCERSSVSVLRPSFFLSMATATAVLLGALGSSAARAAAGAGSPVVLVSADDEIDARSEARRFSKAFAQARTPEEREAAVESVAEIGDPKIVKELIEALEGHLKTMRRARAELEEAQEKLAPYVAKDELLEGEWRERDRLSILVDEIGTRVAAEDDVALAIVDALVEQRSDEVVEFLADWGLRNRSWRVRAEIVAALGRMATDDAIDTIVIATRDRDARVRQVAVEQAAKVRKPEVNAYLIDRLADEEWPVRAAAVAALAERKVEAAVGPLILQMGEEEGRLRDDCAKALEAITGETFGDSVRAWRDWWAENHLEKLEESKSARGRRKAVSFQTVTTNSTAIVYVVDISDSMNEAAGSAELNEAGIGRRDDVDRSKFDVVVKELIGTIAGLPEETMFNVIVYNHEVKRWKDEMQRASKRAKNEALEYLLAIRPTGGTNIFDSLESAFDLAGRGASDKYYRPLVDTIYFLSDGAPSAGRFTETSDILREIDRMNRFRKLTIHAIGVGKLHDRDFMRSLAHDHGGRYVQRL